MTKDLLLEYDESVDAAYITVKEADWDHTRSGLTTHGVSTMQRTAP